MKKIIKYPLVLGCICAASGLLISAVYAVSYPFINANQFSMLQNVYSNATFEEVERDVSEYTYLQGVYSATSGGEVVGYVYNAYGTAYGNPLGIYIGINADETGTLETVYIYDNQQSYATQVSNWVSSTFTEPIEDISTIDVVSGATASSRVIVSMIEEAQADYLKGGF